MGEGVKNATLEEILAEIRALGKDTSDEFKEMRGRLDNLEGISKEVKHLREENDYLKEEISKQKDTANVQEQHSKSKNLLIYDIPGKAKESFQTTTTIIQNLVK